MNVLPRPTSDMNITPMMSIFADRRDKTLFVMGSADAPLRRDRQRD